MVYHRTKVSKYGDRLLETIENTISEHYKMDKNSSGSKGSADSTKRRREANGDPDANAEDDDDDAFIKSTGRSKKRTVKRQNKKAEVYDSAEEDYYHGCLDEELDFDNIENEALDKITCRNDEGRVLPQWTAS